MLCKAYQRNRCALVSSVGRSVYSFIPDQSAAIPPMMETCESDSSRDVARVSYMLQVIAG